jgi:integrase
MTGNVQKRYGYWRVVIELGEQAALRCPTCRKRHWVEDGKPSTCPADHGEPEEVVARRQEMLPEKYEAKKEASKALRDALTARERGEHVSRDDRTTGDYLVDDWLPTLEALELRPNTKLAYRLHVEKRIVPKIGSIPLQKLTYSDIVKMHARLASEDGPRGHVLSPSTRRGVLAVLHKALAEAVRAKLILTNPADGVEYPKVRRTGRLETWDADELDKFLKATSSDRLSPLWMLLSKTGMRRGEALGLKWEDVGLDTGSVYLQRSRHQVGYQVVEGPLKGGDGRHVHIGAGTVAALKAWKAQQNTERLRWGSAWQDTGHVFTRENGEPWHPNKVTESFGEAVSAVGVKRIRVHDLRHTHATLWLRAGGHPKVLQERLGHKSIKITMDTYSHALPTMQEGIADVLDAVVYGEAR